MSTTAVFFKLVIKSAAANSEDRCGFFLVSRRRSKGHGDKFLFCSFKGHADMDRKACQEGLPIRLPSVPNSCREKIGRQFFTFRNQDGALDHVLKLSHIARPGITLKASERLSGDGSQVFYYSVLPN